MDNTVLFGDCFNVMQGIPDKSVDMILCDLPYGTTRNPWDSVLDFQELWRHYNRIAKENAAIVLTSHGLFTAQIIMSNARFFKYKLVWQKSKATNFLNAKKQPLRKHEDICVFYRKPPSYTPQMSSGTPYAKGMRKDALTGSYGAFKPTCVQSVDGSRYPTDIISFPTAEAEGKVWHPTQKPVALGRYLIRTYSQENDVILDNTCGSGSFLVAAHQEKRRFIGIEIDTNYQNIIEQRIPCAKVIKTT